MAGEEKRFVGKCKGTALHKADGALKAIIKARLNYPRRKKAVAG